MLLDFYVKVIKGLSLRHTNAWTHLGEVPLTSTPIQEDRQTQSRRPWLESEFRLRLHRDV